MTKVPLEKQQADEAARVGDVIPLAALLHSCRDRTQLTKWYRNAGYSESNNDEENAKSIICHLHRFNTWPEYEKFAAELRNPGSLIPQFEQAADAIITGDAATLKNLLRQNPALINMRSVRNHQSTLLNYIGANGFEEYRQKTPKNAVEIATILLDAGAEVDAWGDMYLGTSTLGLVATSIHPVEAGVQLELMDILIQYGADPNHAIAPGYTEGNLILACIHNGRPEPINYLAEKGALVELEGAGALGGLDKIKS